MDYLRPAGDAPHGALEWLQYLQRTKKKDTSPSARDNNKKSSSPDAITLSPTTLIPLALASTVRSTASFNYPLKYVSRSTSLPSSTPADPPKDPELDDLVAGCRPRADCEAEKASDLFQKMFERTRRLWRACLY